MEAMVALIMVDWVVVSTFIAAAVLKWLWNITLPELFGFKTLRYWQAFRLLIIAQLLFGPAFFKLTSPPPRSVSTMMGATTDQHQPDCVLRCPRTRTSHSG